MHRGRLEISIHSFTFSCIAISAQCWSIIVSLCIQSCRANINIFTREKKKKSKTSCVHPRLAYFPSFAFPPLSPAFSLCLLDLYTQHLSSSPSPVLQGIRKRKGTIHKSILSLHHVCPFHFTTQQYKLLPNRPATIAAAEEKKTSFYWPSN